MAGCVLLREEHFLRRSFQGTPLANVALQGTIWTSLGIGILLSSQLVRSARLGEDFERFLVFLSVWAYPAISVGVGMLAYAWFNREKKS